MLSMYTAGSSLFLENPSCCDLARDLCQESWTVASAALADKGRACGIDVGPLALLEPLGIQMSANCSMERQQTASIVLKRQRPTVVASA